MLNTAFITWFVIVAAVVILAAVTIGRHKRRNGHTLIEPGEEKDEFFIPGDNISVSEHNEVDDDD